MFISLLIIKGGINMSIMYSRVLKSSNLMRVIVLTLIMLLLFYLVDTSLINSYVAASNGWDVLVFVGKALVGGAIYDLAKGWVLSSGALAALTPVGATLLLSGLALIGTVVAYAYMNSGGSRVLNYRNSQGCITTDGKIWHCPYGADV